MGVAALTSSRAGQGVPVQPGCYVVSRSRACPGAELAYAGRDPTGAWARGPAGQLPSVRSAPPSNPSPQAMERPIRRAGHASYPPLGVRAASISSDDGSTDMWNQRTTGRRCHPPTGQGVSPNQSPRRRSPGRRSYSARPPGAELPDLGHRAAPVWISSRHTHRRSMSARAGAGAEGANGVGPREISPGAGGGAADPIRVVDAVVVVEPAIGAIVDGPGVRAGSHP